MNKKLRSTLVLLILLILVLVAGGIYIFAVQNSEIDEKKEQLEELNVNAIDPEELTQRYEQLTERSIMLDSILANRPFNIPLNLSSIKFYNFINDAVTGYSPVYTQVNVEYVEQKQDKEFFYHLYKLSGHGYFNDVYKLIYAIESSKELKKIQDVSFGNLVKTSEEEVPQFLVSFTMNAQVYFSNDSRFAPPTYVENDLSTGSIYDIFYPLIRNEIPPNIDGLLDVQGAKLLALIPEGAFLADDKGNTYLIWEGEQVYLGYLTKIDYNNSAVSFILNKGGIIEKLDLSLEKTEIKKKGEK